jgi:hypothetical protein
VADPGAVAFPPPPVYLTPTGPSLPLPLSSSPSPSPSPAPGYSLAPPPVLDTSTYGLRDFPPPPPPQHRRNDPHRPRGGGGDGIPCEPARWLGLGPGPGWLSPDTREAAQAGYTGPLDCDSPLPVSAFPPAPPPPRSFHALRVPDQGESVALASHVHGRDARWGAVIPAGVERELPPHRHDCLLSGPHTHPAPYALRNKLAVQRLMGGAFVGGQSVGRRRVWSHRCRWRCPPPTHTRPTVIRRCSCSESHTCLALAGFALGIKRAMPSCAAESPPRRAGKSNF